MTDANDQLEGEPSFDDGDLKSLFADVAPTAGFEDRVIGRLRRSSSRQTRLRIHPIVYRSAAVAASIAVLAASGYVATNNVTMQSRRADYAADLRQIGQAPLLSSNDNKGLYPAAAAPSAKPMTGGFRLRDMSQPEQSAGSSTMLKSGKTNNHDEDGQNVLYRDGYTNFEKNPFVGVQRDNVYTTKSGSTSFTGGTVFKSPYDGNDTIVLPKDDGDDAKTDPGSAKRAQSAEELRFKPKNFDLGRSSAALQREREQETFPALKTERAGLAKLLGETQNKSADPSGGVQAQPAQNAPPPATNATLQRRIIRNGTIEFEVDAFDATVSRLTSIVIEEGGFIATTNSDKLPNGKVRGVIVVRVSPDRLDALVLKLRALGDLKSQNLTAQDVSKQYSDLESELRAARAMETRLLEMIKSGQGSIKDLLSAEKELGVWREKIEKVTGEINYYNNLVSLSTLQITLTEKDIRSAAAVNETETVDMGVESEDVEKSRAETIKAIDDVKGRIVESQLKQFDAGQLAAKVVADVSREKAGETIDRLKQLGKVARLDLQRATTTIDGQPAKPGARVERADTRISVSFYNLANVAPRVTTTMAIACEDVESTYRTILERIGKAPGGRVITSNINRQQGAAGASASISFETKTDAADAALADVRAGGEVMKLESTENPDTANVTRAKRGFSITLVSTATAAPRQVTSTNIAAADVVKSYESIVAAARKAGARIAVSRLDQQASRPTTATLDFEVRRTEAATIDAALAGAGDAVTHNTFVNSDTANTLESKVGYHLALAPADSLPPRESIGMSIEHARVDESISAITKLVADAGGRIVDSNVNQQDRGRTTAHLTIDVLLDKAETVRDGIKSIGRVRAEQSTKNAQVPAGNLSRARIDLTIADPESLVDADGGFWTTLRRGLSTSAAGLLWSLQLIIVGVCLVAPWAIALWGGWKIVKRMRKSSSLSLAGRGSG